ncbi:putative signal transduction histidine kinase [Bifidobacterium callitrichos DSM 23973]|uniref:Putative signal transduction histidine kinase n=2 Tax=Bifidobacterium callitrichos TaxID=762209 RepID=A0A087AC50_9BIFI|nr:putative signal transduction histidine kinase [Bifidobacterium callitrichos DSM 23973]
MTSTPNPSSQAQPTPHGRANDAYAEYCRYGVHAAYARSQPRLPPMLPARLPLMRPKHGRMLTGVCQGISLHLGVSVAWVRLAFVLMTFLFGAGIVAYLFLWMFVPVGDPAAAAAARSQSAKVSDAPLARGNRDMSTGKTRAESREETALGTAETVTEALKRAPKPALLALSGLTLIALSLVLGVTNHGELIPAALLAAAGLLVAWSRFDARTGQLPTMVGGIILIFLAYVSYVTNVMYSGLLSYPKRIILAGFLLLVGVVLAILPWANSMLRSLTAERASKEREEERADMTAHLHDGVLQTLALIQLHSSEPDTVFTLARGQERELRQWLYQTRVTSDRSVGAGLKEIAAHVEDEHGRPIEVVTVGDARPSAATDALLDATQQALVNAVTHGGEPISVYCEAGPALVEVFVRDHGAGFDVDAIPPDRLGIRESIIGRIRRRGGKVEIVSRPGWGTEVRMHMPIRADGRSQADAMQGKERSDERTESDD